MDFFADGDEKRKERRHRKRFSDVDDYEYEMPSDANDEEIDSYEAFGESDEERYGDFFGGDKGVGVKERAKGKERMKERDDLYGDFTLDSDDEKQNGAVKKGAKSVKAKGKAKGKRAAKVSFYVWY